MKRFLVITFYSIAFITCGTKTEPKSDNASLIKPKEIRVLVDTLNIPITGSLSKVVLFRDNFYVMFETSRENTSESFKKMIVLNQKGQFIEDVFVPKEIQEMPHYDLIVDNDSLYVKESQFEKLNFVLGEYVADFKLMQSKEFAIFKDDNYNIYSSCNGEFGGTIYFQNIKTKKNYEAASTCPTVVNKIGNDYYITNYMGHMNHFASVLKISDPVKLEQSDLDFKTQQGSQFNKGVEILIDTIGFYISTSFVTDNRLLNLYSDKQGAYIGEIINKKINPVYKFDFAFSAFFSQQLSDGRQIATCYFPDKKNGILMISGNDFHFYKLQ